MIRTPPYRAPLWLPGGHLQTIWPALHGRQAPPTPSYQRARWTAPDSDFIDVDWLDDAAPRLGAGESAPPSGKRPLLVLFHGLEGSSQSHYARIFANHARQQGWAYAVPHFRGCSGEINLAPRAYHSGDYPEVDWILRRFKREHSGPIVVVGISMGGNMLLRWAEEAGHGAAQVVQAVATICSPLDLAAGGWALGRGLNRRIYTPMFLKTMRHKALQKLQQFPGLFDRQALDAAQDLHAFDNVFTAPLHGFRDADDYWARASAKSHLHLLRVPSLLVHARNDPFVPAWSLPTPADVGAATTLWQLQHGGHVGFAQGRPPGHLHYLPHAVGGWLGQHCS